MASYIIKRILHSIPVFFGITLISFFVINLAPGKAIDVKTGFNPNISYTDRQKLERLYGLDKSAGARYLEWLVRFVRFDFGMSLVDDRPVLRKIAERLPVTVFINSLSMLIIFAIGIPLGVAAAVRKGSFYDKTTTGAVFAGFSVPEFWIALIAMNFICIKLGWLPISGLRSLDFEYYSLADKMADILRHVTLPVCVAALGSLAAVTRYMRSSMVETLNKDFIRMARAKGLKESVVIYRHALKNSLLPVITIMGLAVPGLIGGSVIFESIFAIPGMGRLFYESVMARDYPTIMGILSLGAILTLAGNMLADIAYSYADPRIRTGQAK